MEELTSRCLLQSCDRYNTRRDATPLGETATPSLTIKRKQLERIRERKNETEGEAIGKVDTIICNSLSSSFWLYTIHSIPHTHRSRVVILPGEGPNLYKNTRVNLSAWFYSWRPPESNNLYVRSVLKHRQPGSLKLLEHRPVTQILCVTDQPDNKVSGSFYLYCLTLSSASIIFSTIHWS